MLVQKDTNKTGKNTVFLKQGKQHHKQLRKALKLLCELSKVNMHS